MTTTPSDDEPYRATLHDKWALAGTWLILASIAGITNGITTALHGLVQFFTGDVAGLKDTHYGHDLFLPAVLGSIVIAVPLLFAASWVAERVYGKATSNYMQRRTMTLRKVDGATVHIVRATAVRDVVEELFARGFLLGLLALPFGSLIGQTVAFYVLFGLSAIPQVLAYHHMYRDEKEQRQLGRLAPHFLGMVILAVAFVQFGLLASVLVHLLYNLVLASLDRFTAYNRQGVKRVIIGSSILVILGVGELLLQGLSPIEILHLEFTSFHHYLWAVLCLSGLLMLVLELLMYDPEPLEVGLVRRVPAGPSSAEAVYKGHFRVVTEEVKPSTTQLFAGEIANAFLATATTCMWAILVYGVANVFVVPPFYWIAMVAVPAVLCYIFGSRSVSVNGTARVVWENGPVLILVISAFPVIGFWPTVAVSVCREIACRLIRRPIRYAGM